MEVLFPLPPCFLFIYFAAFYGEASAFSDPWKCYGLPALNWLFIVPCRLVVLFASKALYSLPYEWFQGEGTYLICCRKDL